MISPELIGLFTLGACCVFLAHQVVTLHRRIDAHRKDVWISINDYQDYNRERFTTVWDALNRAHKAIYVLEQSLKKAVSKKKTIKP